MSPQNKRRRNKNRNKNNQQFDNRNKNIKSVSTSFAKKETVTSHHSQNNSKPEQFEKTNQDGERKKTSFYKNKNKTHKKNNAKEQKVQSSFTPFIKGVSSAQHKQELKKQFMRAEATRLLSEPRVRIKRTINRSKHPLYTPGQFSQEVCYICSKNITNMSTMLHDEEKERYAHFDCEYDKIRERYQLASHERIAYIGNGAFAVIEESQDPKETGFKIKQRIQITPAKSIK